MLLIFSSCPFVRIRNARQKRDTSILNVIRLQFNTVELYSITINEQLRLQKDLSCGSIIL